MPRFRRQQEITLVVKPRVIIALILGLLLVGLPRLQNARTIVAAAAPVNINAKRRAVAPDARYVHGEVLVRFRSDGDAPAASIGTATKSGERKWMSLRSREERAEIAAEIERFDGSELVEGLRLARVRPEDTLAAVEAFAERPDVLYAEPNYIWRKDATPNDPRFPEMYALKNTGQSGGSVGSDIDAEPAWDITTGSNSVVVGVIDSGVDINHQDLKDNIWVNPGETPNNGVDDDNNGYVDDTNGWDFYHNDRTVFDNENGDDHATHVAGTIGARGNNGVGTVGVNWQVSIMSLKVLGPDGGGTISKFVQAYNYARTMRERGINIRVLNNSYGGSEQSQAARDAINQLNQAGILFVASAGNDAVDNFKVPHYPSNYDLPNVISVAATNSFDGLSSFSNFGDRVVSIGAPGSAILSTTPNNGYAVFSGTSMASPHVSGAAALVCAASPNISLQQLRGVLAYGGDVLSSLGGKTTTGRRVNARNSVQSALENDATPPSAPGNLRITEQSGRVVYLAWDAPGDDGNTGQAADYDFVFNNSTTGAKTPLPIMLLPAPAGTAQSATAVIPLRNFSGSIELRTFDNVGNSSVASLPVSLSMNHSTDPYLMNLGPASALSTGGERLNLNGDDKYLDSYFLPFTFQFFERFRGTVTVSTNGALYISNSPPPTRGNGDADDADSSIAGLNGQSMIAGMWDDLVIDNTLRPSDGVYVVRPDSDAVIFRWQGATYEGDHPVNFEIELRRNGAIIFRYGDGNAGLYPVVGISGGEPDAYVVESHTLERAPGVAPKSLTNAQTVTFTRRPVVVSTFQFSAANYQINENEGNAVVTVTRAGDTASAQSINYATGNNTAEAGADYVSASGILMFAAGEASKIFNVPIINDSLPELYETVRLTISNPTNGATLGGQITAMLTIFDDESSGLNTVQFGSATYSVGEGDGKAVITVTRIGDTKGAARVNYATMPGGGAMFKCDTGTSHAFEHCDYSSVAGVIRFAPNETQKTFVIPIVDDVYVENEQSLSLTLSEPVGATFGPERFAFLTIKDNDTVPPTAATNPFNRTDFFVRQHYLDFLGREPDTSGFADWQNVLNTCGANRGGLGSPVGCDRVHVSSGFYRSPEFTDRGYFVYRFYEAALGRLPLYRQFISDTASISGFQTAEENEAGKAEFITNFMSSPDFQAKYSFLIGTNAAGFIEKLEQTAGVTVAEPLRSQLISEMSSGQKTAAQTLRAFVESQQVYDKFFFRGFVAMQYFGYLRRDPEAAGYNDWVDVITNGRGAIQPKDYRHMIFGFIYSTEYRQRFGPP